MVACSTSAAIAGSPAGIVGAAAAAVVEVTGKVTACTVRAAASAANAGKLYVLVRTYESERWICCWLLLCWCVFGTFECCLIYDRVPFFVTQSCSVHAHLANGWHAAFHCLLGHELKLVIYVLAVCMYVQPVGNHDAKEVHLNWDRRLQHLVVRCFNQDVACQQSWAGL